MKKLKMFIVILIGMTIVSCGDKGVSGIITNGDKINGHDIFLREYQGCEYLFLEGGYTHKGNCKNPIHCYNK